MSSGNGYGTMQLRELRPNASDSDFEPPYTVVASPEQCSGNSAWDRATPTNPAASAIASNAGEYHDALTRYFNVRSKVTYNICFHGGDGGPPTFVGPLAWTKDGTNRARFDLTETGGSATSYIVSRTDQTICTADVSKYLEDHAGGNQLKAYGLQSLLKYSEICFPDIASLGGNGGFEYEQYVLRRMFVVPNALAIGSYGLGTHQTALRRQVIPSHRRGPSFDMLHPPLRASGLLHRRRRSRLCSRRRPADT